MLIEIPYEQWTGSSLSGVFKYPNVVSCRCPSCGNSTNFSIPNSALKEAERSLLAAAKCAGCGYLVRFLGFYSAEPGLEGYDTLEILNVYSPQDRLIERPNLPENVPEPLARSLYATIDAFNSENFMATSVVGRRTLEGIFKYLVNEAERKTTLNKLIENVGSNFDFSAPISRLAHAIRSGGNLGAHFDMEKEPDRELAKQMVDLLLYLISYLYVLPKSITDIEAALDK